MAIVAPTTVDGGQPFTLKLNADVTAGVPLMAVADLKPKAVGSGCAPNPAAEPTSAVPELTEQVTDTQQPAGIATATDQGISTPGYGTYLVCAWLLAGWTNTQNPPTVAGPISTTVTALRPEVFRGRSSQHLAIKITVAPVERLVLDVAYSDRLRCRGTASFSNGLRWNGVWSDELNTNTFGTLRIGARGRSAPTSTATPTTSSRSRGAAKAAGSRARSPSAARLPPSPATPARPFPAARGRCDIRCGPGRRICWQPHEAHDHSASR